MNRCRLCEEDAVRELLDLGPQPICNRFLKHTDQEQYTHPMVLGQCGACGLIQIKDPVPACELLPPYEWITYNEPEGHLDTLADVITSLPELTKQSVICGISYKDDTLLERMNNRGFKNTWRMDLQEDLNITEYWAGVETVQDMLTCHRADSIVKARGKVDVVIARHILEHSYDIREIVNAMRRLLKPGGYLVLEVPDCSRAFETFDYTTLWEEHIAYFTQCTFLSGLPLLGCRLVRSELFPYPFENSLVGIGKFLDDESLEFPPEAVLKEEKNRVNTFAAGFEGRKRRVKEYLEGFRSCEGKIAVFGAGHLACCYINLFELQGTVDFVVDDNPNKRRLFMPGSRLPIYESSALLEQNVKLCLLSLSPESEEKVIQKNQEYIQGGGKFASVIPSSRYALIVE